MSFLNLLVGSTWVAPFPLIQVRLCGEVGDADAPKVFDRCSCPKSTTRLNELIVGVRIGEVNYQAVCRSFDR